MTDFRFSKTDILEHRGDVLVFCPAVEAKDSTYKRVRHRQEFVGGLFGPSQFHVSGRIENGRMLLCVLPSFIVSKFPPFEKETP